MKKYIFLLSLFIAAGCGSKSSVSRIGVANDDSANSFYYALPKSNLIVTTDIEKKSVTPGVYEKVAKYFGYDDNSICHTAKITYKVAKNDVTTKSYFDENQIFKYNFSKNFLNKNDFKIEYDANGEIINSEVTNESQVLPVISSVVGFVSSIYGAASTLSLQLTTFNNAGMPLSDTKLFEEAKVDFKALNDLKTNYYNALQNDNGATKEIVELKLKKLEDAINDLTSKFTGTVEKKTFQLVFEIDPSDFVTTGVDGITRPSSTAANLTKALFYFDADNGVERILQQDWFSPISEIENAGVSHNKTFSIKLLKIDNEMLISLNPDINKTKTSGGLFYRMPVNAKYSIYSDNSGTIKNEKSFEIVIPQYGLTLAAPDNMKSMNFKLHPKLGSILLVNGTTKSIDVDAVDKLGTNASELLNKFKKEEEPNKKDELIKDLERDIKIKDLQQQLNSSE